MKIIYRYLFKKFLGPFALTFFFALFILLMQFLWKYVDDLVGKGLEVGIILELLFYASATFVSMAVPLAVLLSSLMTFGSLGEQYEIIAMKSAGISMNKLITALSICVFCIACSSFWFSNKVAPKSYYKFKVLLRNVMDQKPTLSIEEGIFYQGFDNYIMRVGKKDRNNTDIYDVILFDHTKGQGQGNSTYTYAKRGKMQMTDDKKYMLFYLYEGFYWDESPSSNAEYPLVRSNFLEKYKRFDISSFQFEKSDDDFYANTAPSLSNAEIVRMIDSTKMTLKQTDDDLFANCLFTMNYFRNYVMPDTSSFLKKSALFTVSYDKMNNDEKLEIINRALMQKNELMNYVNSSGEYKKYLYSSIDSYKTDWYKKYVLAIACILFFFIGAPLGSIIRKGGVAVPLVITVLFFVIYFIISVFGEKIAKGGAVQVWIGMGLSTFILIPICIFLTYQASVDSALLSSEELHKKLQHINLKIFTKKKNENTSTHA